MKRITTLFLFMCGSISYSSAQCCSGGSGSPIAGGASQGVLANRQIEVASSFQYIYTEKFFEKDSRISDSLINLSYYSSKYNYTRLAYGVTKNFTFSVEGGYFIDKSQYRLDHVREGTKGFGDLLFFPRYDIYNHCGDNSQTEITLGMGIKIPIGKFNDSLRQLEPFSGKMYAVVLPPAVQLSTGSQDFVFYAFGLKSYTDTKIKFFANALYVRKGFNPDAEKFGDYASIGIFVGKTFFNKLNVTIQMKGEHVDTVSYNKRYFSGNYDPAATGNKKVLFVPQLSYTFKSLTCFILSEIPVYQYVNKKQIGSQYLMTGGFTYRFMIRKSD